MGRVLRGWDVRPGEKGWDGVGESTKGTGGERKVLLGGEKPPACHLGSAGPAEVNHLKVTHDNVDVIEAEGTEGHPHPERLILDWGYDGDQRRSGRRAGASR